MPRLMTTSQKQRKQCKLHELILPAPSQIVQIAVNRDQKSANTISQSCSSSAVSLGSLFCFFSLSCTGDTLVIFMAAMAASCAMPWTGALRHAQYHAYPLKPRVIHVRQTQHGEPFKQRSLCHGRMSPYCTCCRGRKPW